MRRFDTAKEFQRGCDELIDEHMPQSPSACELMRLREDVVYWPEEDGFSLVCRGSRLTVTGFEGAARLGEMLLAGRSTRGEILAELAATGADVFIVADTVQRLFDRGILDGDDVAALQITHAEARAEHPPARPSGFAPAPGAGQTDRSSRSAPT